MCFSLPERERDTPENNEVGSRKQWSWLQARGGSGNSMNIEGVTFLFSIIWVLEAYECSYIQNTKLNQKDKGEKLKLKAK